MDVKKTKIFVIGDINIDLALEKIDKSFCFEENLGREIKLENTSFGIGGQGFNFVKIGNAIGLKVNFIGKVGDDYFGKYIKGYLKENKIENYLIIDKNVKTGITVLFPIEKERIYFSYYDACKSLSLDEIPLEKLMGYQHMHLSTYYLLEGMQNKFIDILKHLKSKSKITVSFDTGIDPYNDWQRDNIYSILEHVDVFMPNKAEALNITDSQSIKEALKILSKYCPLVIVKLGEEGAVGIKNDSDVVYVPPFEIDFKDNSCCGDSFNAGFIYYYLNNKSLEDSLKFANACGAYQATKLGNYSFKNIEDINNFVASSKLSGSFDKKNLEYKG
jgi:sugar/nucleoside kinase (ribokinase family)